MKPLHLFANISLFFKQTNRCQMNSDTNMAIRATDQNDINQVVLFEKAKKTANIRTALGLYIAYNNATVLKTAIVAASCLPADWLEKIEKMSDKQINSLLKIMPGCLKGNLKSIYTLHTGYVLGGNSIHVITPMIHSMETALAVKLSVQAVNRSVQIYNDHQEDDENERSSICKTVSKLGERVAIAGTNCAFAHMVTKSQNVAAATVGASAVSFFPDAARTIHDKTDSFINEQVNKLPKATVPLLSMAYGVHEIYLSYFGPIPYVTEAVIGVEALSSFYIGAKYMLHNITQAVVGNNTEHAHDQ